MAVTKPVYVERIRSQSERIRFGKTSTSWQFTATLLSRAIFKSMVNGAEGQNRTVDTSLFRAVLYQLSYLGTRSRNKEVALLQNWPEKIKVPSTNSGEFSPVDRIKHEGLGLSERLQNQDTCCVYPTAFMRIPSVRASLVWRRGRDLNPR